MQAVLSRLCVGVRKPAYGRGAVRGAGTVTDGHDGWRRPLRGISNKIQQLGLFSGERVPTNWRVGTPWEIVLPSLATALLFAAIGALVVGMVFSRPETPPQKYHVDPPAAARGDRLPILAAGWDLDERWGGRGKIAEIAAPLPPSRPARNPIAIQLQSRVDPVCGAKGRVWYGPKRWRSWRCRR